MMDFVRTKLKDSIFVKIMLGLLTLSFGIWGVGDFIGAGGLDPTIAVKVGKTEIRTEEFQRRYAQEMQRFKQSVGDQAGQEEALRRSVVNAVIQDVTNSATMNAVARDMNVSVPQSTLRDAIRGEKAFADKTGSFSQEQFAQLLAQNNLTEKGFVDLFAEDMRRAEMLGPVAANIAAPKTLTDTLFGYRTETRVADTLLVPADAMTLNATPTEDQLKDTYQKNIATFTSPEYRKLTAVVLTPGDLVKPESLEESDLKTYYDQNTARYRTPAKRHIVQLLFDNKQKADAAFAAVTPGESLEELAAKTKTGPVIDLGDLAADAPISKTIAAAFVLPEKEISPPVQTDLGWHLFEVTKISPEAATPFEEVKDKIRAAVAADKGTDAMYDASVQLEDAVAAGTPLPDIAKNLNARLVTIDAMNRDGKDPKGADVPNLVDRANFIRTAFSTDAGADSGLKEFSTRNGYFVLKVDSITAPKAKPLDEVRPQVVAAWEKEARQAEAQKVADKLVAGLKGDTAMTALQADKRVSYASLGPVTRFGDSLSPTVAVDAKRVSPEVLDHLFSSKVGEVFAAPVVDGIVVAKVKDIQPAQAVGPLAASRDQLNQTLQSSISNDLIEEMTRAFAARYPVEVNNTVIDDMVAKQR